MDAQKTMGRELDWDDTIEKDYSEFVPLPEGDYSFTVEDFERGRHNGSEKLPPCNKAVLKIRIENEEREVVLTHNLFLHTNMEGRLSEFFSAIGQKKKGERLRMNWNQVTGATGRLKLGIRTRVSEKDGKTRKYNEIKRFYPKEDTGAPKFTPGTF